MDDILNICNVHLDNIVGQIYPSELQLDTEVAFLDLHVSISNDIVSTKLYDKRDDFDFEIVNFPLALHPMESIALNSFVSLEHVAMLLTSTLAKHC